MQKICEIPQDDNEQLFEEIANINNTIRNL